MKNPVYEREVNHFSKFYILQDALMTPQFFLTSHFARSNDSQRAAKLTAGILKN
jgi:hypothetical protein